MHNRLLDSVIRESDRRADALQINRANHKRFIDALLPSIHQLLDECGKIPTPNQTDTAEVVEALRDFDTLSKSCPVTKAYGKTSESYILNTLNELMWNNANDESTTISHIKTLIKKKPEAMRKLILALERSYPLARDIEKLNQEQDADRVSKSKDNITIYRLCFDDIENDSRIKNTAVKLLARKYNNILSDQHRTLDDKLYAMYTLYMSNTPEAKKLRSYIQYEKAESGTMSLRSTLNLPLNNIDTDIHRQKRSGIVSSLIGSAMTGIYNYQQNQEVRNRKHLGFFAKLFDRSSGMRRARMFDNAFKSNLDEENKLIALYALLTTTRSPTLQQFVVKALSDDQFVATDEVDLEIQTKICAQKVRDIIYKGFLETVNADNTINRDETRKKVNAFEQKVIKINSEARSSVKGQQELPRECFARVR